MKKKILWCVVVGRPKMKFWKIGGGQPDPDMKLVGKVYEGSYDTRREARDAAWNATQFNPAWNYHARKMP